MGVHILEPTRNFLPAVALLLLWVVAACSPAAAPGDAEPGREPLEPTVAPPNEEVTASVECSSDASVIEVRHDDAQIPMEQLIDRAAVIIHASGVGREQVRFPESQSSSTEGQTTCEWVVLAEVAVLDYLKGEGPKTVRVALPVAEFPGPDREMAAVGDLYDIEVGSEYVLFLDANRFTRTWDPSDRTWTVLFESHGRWPMDGESLLTRLEPPEDEVALDELWTAISPLGTGVLPTVGPLGRAVSTATGCPSDVAEIFDSEEEFLVGDTHILYELLPLEKLIDEATVIVHVWGAIREQVNVPYSGGSYSEGKPVCEWVVFAEVEVQEYLKGDGPDTLRVALKVGSGPQPDRPLVRVEHVQNVKEGFEYVLFLRAQGFPDSWGLSGRYWNPVAGPQGRWPAVGGTWQTRLEPPLDKMTIDELRAAISP